MPANKTGMFSSACVVGLGRIGLPCALVLVERGYQVTGVDTDLARLRAIEAAAVDPHEPGLADAVRAALASGRLRLRSSPVAAECHLLCVATPLSSSGEADLTALEAATKSVAGVLRGGDLVVVESTVPVGTTEGLVARTLERSGLRAGADFALAHCAERVWPGRILLEFGMGARVVGGLDAASTERALQLYRTVVQGPLVATDCRTGEMTKLIENTYRDVNIALANEIARLCETAGVDAWRAIELANQHPRVHLCEPGPGVGGPCIPVVSQFLTGPAPLIRVARSINDAVPGLLADRIRDLVADISEPSVTLLGLTYRADVSDGGPSPGTHLLANLGSSRVSLRVHDPYYSGPEPTEPDLARALSGADLVVLVADHSIYRSLEAWEVAAAMRTRRLLDTRHLFDPDAWRSAGFEVWQFGCGSRPWMVEERLH